MIFIDTESLGLGPQSQLVEVGLALVRKNFTIRDKISVVINTTPAHWAGVKPVVAEMHTANGLIKESLASQLSIADAQLRLMNWLVLKHQLAAGKHPMCGSTICGDKVALSVQMPQLHAFFGFRMLDVSSFSELAKYLNSSLIDSAPRSRKIHRALPDIEDSVAKLKFWAAKFKLGVNNDTGFNN